MLVLARPPPMADITALQPAATVADAQRGAAGRRYWGVVAGRLRRDRLTVAVGAIVLLFVGLVVAPLAATHDPPLVDHIASSFPRKRKPRQATGSRPLFRPGEGSGPSFASRRAAAPLPTG
jgi:hypothetical protein